MGAEPRRIVYTALIGNYEQLCEQPVAATSDIPFVCFTDDPGLVSESWDVRLVDPQFRMDPIRSARQIKISPLADYDETLWIDARVELKVDPAQILGEWLADVDISMPRHSHRKDVVTEFNEVLLAGLDEHTRLYEQLSHYATIAPEELTEPVPWTGMIARRRTAQVDDAMERWFLDVVRYSHRDQLSVVRALRASGVAMGTPEINTWLSDLHDWKAPVDRSARPAVFRISDSLQPPIAAIGELRHELETTTRQLTDAVSHREGLLAKQAEVVERLKEKNADLTKQIRQLRRRGRARRTLRRLVWNSR